MSDTLLGLLPCAHTANRFEEALKQAAAAAADASAVRTVIVSGGVAQSMPALQQAVTRAFPKASIVKAAPTAAAQGAALLLASQRCLLR